MSAYLVFICEKTIDEGEMAKYVSEIGSTFAGHTPKVLAEYGAHEDLEGSPTEGAVVVEFPSMEAAKAWYESPAYREVRQHRFKGAIYRGLLVEGV